MHGYRPVCAPPNTRQTTLTCVRVVTTARATQLRESTGMADIDQFIRACTPGTGLRVGPVFPPDPPVSWSSKPRPATARRPGERFVPLELPPRPSTAMVGGRPWKPFGEYGPKPMQQRPQSARPHTPGQFSRGSAHYM